MSMDGTITLVSNKGKGSTRTVKIATGMTAQEVLFAELGIQDPQKYQMIVDGKDISDPSKCKLTGGEFVIIVPTNVKGG